MDQIITLCSFASHTKVPLFQTKVVIEAKYVGALLHWGIQNGKYQTAEYIETSLTTPNNVFRGHLSPPQFYMALKFGQI